MLQYTRPAVVAFAILLFLGASGSVRAADLATAKGLYASASYEEALDELKAVGPEAAADEVQQYQALCLIALGRTSEAETVIEQLVTRSPLFSVAGDDLSPRFVSMFRTVRDRKLPVVARGLYTQAKASFDRRAYPDSIRQFNTLMTVIGNDHAANEELQALKQLAEGFQKLAEASVQATAPLPAAPPATAATTTSAAQSPPAAIPPVTVAPASPAPPATASARPSPPIRLIFSRENADVRPPEAVSRTIPPAPRALGARNLQGVLVLLINEQGVVESASLAQPISPLYDQDLLTAVRRWRFRPATKEGMPVAYRVSFPIAIAD